MEHVQEHGEIHIEFEYTAGRSKESRRLLILVGMAFG